MKTLFIYNPNAGLKQIKNYLFDILNVFSKANYDLTVYPTKKQKDAINYVRKNGNKYNLIICSGGDGTLNEVVNGLLKSNNTKTKLGYIPAGSTNDFASSLNIPKNMTKAADLITKGMTHKYDIGKFNNDYFVYVAAFGAFTKVSYSTPQDIKNVLGHLAYLIEGIKSLNTIRSYDLKITSKEVNTQGKFIYGMVTNTYSVGGIYKLNKKDVLLDDGLFEVLLIKEPKDPIELGEINAFLINKKRTNMVLSYKTKQITIESKEKLAWTIDGEFGGNQNKVTIMNQRKLINIINK